MKLTVVVSTRNRSQKLKRCLRSVKGIASEVIVIDNESTDDSTHVATSLGATVFTRKNNLMLNVNKNYGFTKATHEWILCLDDDEEVTVRLAGEIKKVIGIKSNETKGYWIARKNIIFGKWIQHGLWWPDRQLRLFRNGAGKYPEKHVHEYISVEGKTENLENPYIHYNYDSLSQYLEKMQNIYTDSEVQKYVSAGYIVHWADAIRFPLSDFIKLYFAQSGYKDGLHGLVLALLQGFYSFIIFVKLWEREKFRDVEIPYESAIGELKRSKEEMSYWVRTTNMVHAGNPLKRFWEQALRKLHL